VGDFGPLLPFEVIMKLFILLILLCLFGCSPVTYVPPGDKGNEIQYFNSVKPFQCNRCKQDTYLYKVNSKNQIICSDCYREIR